jgi:hypothetical protein
MQEGAGVGLDNGEDNREVKAASADASDVPLVDVSRAPSSVVTVGSVGSSQNDLQDSAAEESLLPTGSLVAQAGSQAASDAVKVTKSQSMNRSASMSSTVGGVKGNKDVIAKIAEAQSTDFKRMLKVAARSDREVPRSSILAYLEQEIDQNDKCFEFPWILMYFALFAGMVLLHEHIVDVSQVERNFNGFLQGTSFEGIYVNPNYTVGGHKTIDDIDLVADVWTYLHDAVLPLFLNDNQTTPEHDLERVLRYNHLIGGVTLRQSRRTQVPCSGEHPDLGPFNSANVNPFLENFWCYPMDSVQDQCFGPGATIEGFCPNSKKNGRRLFSAKHAARPRLGVGKKGSAKMNPSDKEIWDNLFVAVMHSHEGLARGLQRLKELQANNWIDDASALMEVALFTLNPDLGVYTQSTTTMFFVGDGGIIPYTQTTSFLSQPYAHPIVFVVDGCWFILWIQMTATWFYRLCKVLGCKRSLRDLFMWVDFFCITGGLTMIIFWIIYVLQLSDLQDEIVNVAVNRPALNATQLTMPYADAMNIYSRSIDELQGKVADMVSFVSLYRVGICWYTMFIVVRFGKAFRAQPRLAIVTNTLINSAVDFIHFLIVMITMLVSYVLAAMFLFGHRIAEFAVFDMAFNKCILILFGDFDFDELMEEDPVTSALWFYTFIIFMLNIMLNMSLAIIMDVYGQAKGDAALSDPIWEQLYMMYVEKRARAYGIIKLKDMYEVLSDMDVEYVGKNSLMEAIPTMSEEQADRIINKVEELESADDEASLTMADALKLVVSTKTDVLEIEKKLTNYISSQQDNRDSLVGERKMGSGKPGSLMRLHPESNKKIRLVEQRLDVIEGFLNEAMAYMVFRGKELRNRLKTIEDKLRGQRDAAANASADLWQNPSARGRSPSPPAPAKIANGNSGPDRLLPITFSA